MLIRRSSIEDERSFSDLSSTNGASCDPEQPTVDHSFDRVDQAMAVEALSGDMRMSVTYLVVRRPTPGAVASSTIPVLVTAYDSNAFISAIGTFTPSSVHGCHRPHCPPRLQRLH